MKTRAMLVCAGVLLSAIPVANATADRQPEVTAMIERMIEQGKLIGVQYVATTPSEILYEYNGGLADVGRAVPVTSDTTFMLYSMTKTFTAAAVVQLAERGAISLDDRIVTYVPEWPYDDSVTVAELVAHTGGVPNPIPLKWVHLASGNEEFNESQALVGVLARHTKQAAEPGAKYIYSNLGYWILGRLVDRVGGGFDRYVQKELIEPLGVSPSELGFAIINPGRHASGYLKRMSGMNLLRPVLLESKFVGGREGKWIKIEHHYVNGPGFGGIVGTARGVSAFLRDQLQEVPKLLSADSRNHMLELQRLRSGKQIPMTLGWHVRDSDEKYYFKEGGGAGYHCEMRIYPDRKLATVVLANRTQINTRSFLDIADAAFLGGSGEEL